MPASWRGANEARMAGKFSTGVEGNGRWVVSSVSADCEQHARELPLVESPAKSTPGILVVIDDRIGAVCDAGITIGCDSV